MPAQITTSETQVNTATIGDQWDPTVTILADGGWVVVWMGRDAVGSETGIFAQRYAADGTPVGSELQVNSASVDQWEGGPSVAALPDGGWIVTWYATSPHGSPSPESAIVYTQRYDSTGAPAGEVQVNALDGHLGVLHPDVAVLADGGWVIIWHSQHSGTDVDENIYGQRYDSTGAPVGFEFQVNTTAARQLLPSVTALDDGGWIVTWMSEGQDGSGWGVYAQRYNADGSANGGETLVTTTTAGDQKEPHLATLDDGGWVITWHSSGQDGSGAGIYAQRYDSSGAPAGGEFQVNSTTANDQLYATVEALSNGGWAVTWLSIVPGADPYGGRIGNVYLQRYDAAGNLVGGETLVGTASEGSFSNLSTRLAAQPDGTLVVTWGQYGTDGSGYGIFARTFDAPVNVIDGTPGDDDLVGTPGDDAINAYAGNDVVTALEGNDTIDGGGDHDFLRGQQGNDTIYGGNGDDLIRPGSGDDYVDGGAGWDRVSFAPTGTDTVSSGVNVSLLLQGIAQDTGQGMDTLVGIEHLTGTEFDDILIGDGGDNWLWGGGGITTPGVTGNDTIDGGDGNDLVEVGTGNHTLVGGNGTDTLSLWGNNSDTLGGVTFSLALQGGAQATGQGSMNASGFENLSGSAHDDSLSGDGNANTIAGDTGNDIISGGAGDDVLLGDGRILVDTHDLGFSGPITTFNDITATEPTLVPGDDTLEGGAGNDYLDGGAGSDTASYANSLGPVEIFLGSGVADEYAPDFTYLSSDTLVNIENVIGSAYDDALFGGAGDNVLEGLGGNDTIFGDGSGDATPGPSGNDTLYGGDGDDSLRGGFGDDQLYGGNDDDHMRGNAGVDYFDGGAETGDDPNTGYGDRISFFEVRATQGVVADLRTGEISNDGFGNVETMVGIESLGADTAYVDTFYGNDGRNFLWASLGDPLYGFGGDDLIHVNAAGLVDGGLGTDLLSLVSAGYLVPDSDADGVAELGPAMTSGWTVDLAAGTTLDGYGNAGTVTGIENVDGSAFDDTLIGDDNANVLNGLDGNDTLEGRGGNDTLDGGDGTDTASYANASGGVVVELWTGTSSGADGDDTLVSIENLTGSAFDDELLGNGLANVLTGLTGDDILFGDAGDDTLDAGDGNDQLYGHTGNDALSAGDGNDFMRAGEGDDTVDGGAGFDRISHYGTALTTGVTVSLLLQGAPQDTGQGMDTLTGIESLSGTAFDDTLIGDHSANWLIAGGDSDDTLIGNGGDDLLEVGGGVGGGDHSLDGGSESDTVSFRNLGNPDGMAAVNVSLELQGAAQDTGIGSMTLSGIENLSGSFFDDTLAGDGGNNTLSGHTGNDTLSGGGGDDTLYGDGAHVAAPSSNGTSGPPTLFSDITTTDPSFVAGNDTLEGGAGNDYLDGGGGSDTASYADASGGVVIDLGGVAATGADGDDTLVSIENATGSAYDDELYGSLENNVLAGLAGHDFLSGWSGDDTLDGGDGNDLVDGDDGADTLEGSGGHDHLRGGAGNDSLYGGAGHDLLRGQDGDDLIDGGDGFDRVSYFAGATAGVTVSLLLQGVAQDTGNGWDTLVGIEALSGTPFDDHMTGDHQANWFLMIGGNDTMLGEGGDDLIEVADGNHVLDGGAGIDSASFAPDFSTGPVTVSLALQGAAQDTGIGMMTLSGIENLSGTTFNDELEGDGGANLLAGNVGNDTLRGDDGADTLYGDGAVKADVPAGVGTSGPIATFSDITITDPTLTPGNDTLLGGRGDDSLYGGRGDDVMTGNQGGDRFVIEAASGDDTVTDFAPNVDTIVFDPSSGAGDFSDLTLTQVGNDTLVTWGTSDSLLLESVRPRQLDADDFEFGASALTAFDLGFVRGHSGDYDFA